MATKKSKKKNTKKSVPQKITRKSGSNPFKAMNPKRHLSEEVWNGILGTATLVVAIFFIAAHFGSASWVGEYLVSGTTFLVGAVGYWLIPLLFVVLSYTFFRDLDRDFHPMKVVGSLVFLISGLGSVELIFQKGGVVGSFLALLQNPIGFGMALLCMGALFFISLMLIFDGIPFISSWGVDEDDEEVPVKKSKKSSLSAKEQEHIDQATKQSSLDDLDTQKPDIKPKKQILAVAKQPVKEDVAPEENTIEKSINAKIKETFNITEGSAQSGGSESSATVLPPLSLLSKDKGKPDVGDIKSNANVIKRTLSNFGIEVEMGEVEVGPTVTRYAFKPAEGVKLARIAGLKDDLALALAAKTIRMETPIPGKALVGIEIPNKTSTMVGFGSLLAAPGYASSPFTLPLAVGKNIAGQPAFINLAKAPHMLIAGATGAGKSVTVHTLINSLLYKHGPDMLKFIMVDPKRVELTLYNGIPHLLTPVITDAKSAILSLKWAVKEMNRRYDVLQEHAVRDIISYHDNVTAKYVPKEDADQNDRPEKMPYIVVIIDELADIMQAYPRELESGIVQLAQMSRAVGIHLVLSTQRPSVNVITGLIKANIPTRIALQVSSAIDSRTILDMGGAEQLLGKGDMLYMTGEMSKPVRVQCAYLSEEEVKKVVAWVKKQYRGEVPEEIDLSSKAVADANVMFAGSIGDDDEEDDLYEDAKAAVIEAGKASTSYIQRKLRVGYSRAARLMDILEERGVIGPADGSKPREILDDSGSDDGNLLSEDEEEPYTPPHM